MSLDATRWAWAQQLRPAAKLVLLAIADRAGADGSAWPSKESLREATGLNRKTLMGCLHELTQLGLLEDTGKRTGATRQVPIYRLKGPESGPLKGTENGPLVEGKGAQKRTERGPKTDMKGAQKRAPESTKESTKERPVLNTHHAREAGPEFSAFWQSYPRRVAKPPAERAWKKLTEIDRHACLKHLRGSPYAGREARYIPHPGTYLSQRRWEDEAAPATADPFEQWLSESDATVIEGEFRREAVR